MAWQAFIMGGGEHVEENHFRFSGSFLVFSFVAVVSAAPANVTNTNKKRSLLVFPKIEVYASGGFGTTPIYDTYIQIGNDQSAAVSVKCYWMDNNQTIEDFQFTVTANQPVMFAASQFEAPVA